MRGPLRWLLSAAGLLLVALSIGHYVRLKREWAAVEPFVRKFGLDVRRPGLLEQTSLEPSPDFAAMVVADSVVRDELGTVNLTGLRPEERDAWLASVVHRDEEVSEALTLMLRAMASNPGWAFHRLFVGELSFLNERRKPGGAGASPQRWLVPLRQATAMAPGLDPAFSFMGEVMLESWKALDEPARSEARRVLRRAFLDQRALAAVFANAVSVLGRDEALALVPDEPAALTVALAEMVRIGDVPAAARMAGLWEAAELKSRRLDLEKLERRAGMGDLDGVRAGCRAWASAHKVLDFDTSETRKQMARILELWPDDVRGAWRGDPRGEMVRYFLDGRAGDAPRAAMARAVGALTGVPDTARARVALLASDRYEMESVVRSSAGAGSLEWTPFFVEKARAELRDGRPDEALRSLESVAAAARGECSVLLARRDAAAVLSDAAGREGADRLLVSTHRGPLGRESVSPTGAISLCVDPLRDGQGFLEVEVATPAPTLMEWAGNQARWGNRLVEGKAVVRFPLAGFQGRSTFAVGVLAGSPMLVARLERTGERTGLSSLSGDATAAASDAPRTAARRAGVAGSEKLNSTRP